jgi:hypothetical protein
VGCCWVPFGGLGPLKLVFVETEEEELPETLQKKTNHFYI